MRACLSSCGLKVPEGEHTDDAEEQPAPAMFLAVASRLGVTAERDAVVEEATWVCCVPTGGPCRSVGSIQLTRGTARR